MWQHLIIKVLKDPFNSSTVCCLRIHFLLRLMLDGWKLTGTQPLICLASLIQSLRDKLRPGLHIPAVIMQWCSCAAFFCCFSCVMSRMWTGLQGHRPLSVLLHRSDAAVSLSQASDTCSRWAPELQEGLSLSREVPSSSTVVVITLA